MKYSLLLLVFFAAVPYIQGTISDWRLCADPECRVTISSGVAVLQYQSIEPMVLSFNAGDEVTILSKEAGQNKELWGAVVRGRRGYVPKRLVKEMKVFVRSPIHTVPTELIQPTVMQPPSSQTAFNPQQPQMQPNGPQGNQIPHQQQQQQAQQPPHMNPQYPHNNLLPNQPVGIQPPHLPQQQKPLSQQPVQTPSTTTSTASPTPHEYNEENQESIVRAIPLKAELSSIKEEPSVPVESSKELNSADNLEGKINEKEEEGVEDEGADDSDLEEADTDDGDTNEDEDGDSEVLGEEDEEEKVADSKLETNPVVNPVEATNIESDDGLQIKQPTLDSVVDIVDLPGADISPIHSLHARSIDDAIENPISITNEAPNSSSTLEKPSLHSTSLESDPVIDVLPKENQVTDEKQVESVVDTEKTELDQSITAAEVNVSSHAQLNSQDSESSISVVDLTTSNELKETVPTNSSMDVVEPTDELVYLATETEQMKESTPTIQELDPVKEESFSPEPISIETTQSDEGDVLSTNTDPTPLPLDSIESKTDADQRLPDNNETPPIAELSTDPSKPEEISREEGSATDQPSLPAMEKERDEVKPAPSEGSGGGFIDSALNWLGLNDVEEPLQVDKQDGLSTDPAPLFEQIASMNPTVANENQDVHQPSSNPSSVSPENGFCDTQECAQLADNSAKGTIPHDQLHHENDGHNHDHPGHAGHDHHDHQQGHDSHDHHHHHQHGHGSHDHHHHDHDHGAFGHGHSHTPGLIPGFRHHYKPPVVANEQITQPPLPPVEPLPVVAQEVEQFLDHPLPPPISVEHVDPLPIATDQQPSAAEPLPTYVADAVPDYIPVEEIFRAQSEKDRLVQEQQEQQRQMDESDGESWIDSLINIVLSSLTNALSDVKPGDGASSSSLFVILGASAGGTAIFLVFYYAVQNKTVEKVLKARISQLDTQLHESQTASDEGNDIHVKLAEYETDTAQLRTLKEHAEAEKSSLMQQIAELVKERDAIEKEKEAAEKDKEEATDAATEAMRMFTEFESKSDYWKTVADSLQEQLNKQQVTNENLNSSLCVKTAEYETLMNELEELRTDSDRYKVRIKSLQNELETLKASNRTYQQKMAQEGAELINLKQEKEVWLSERRGLTGQINRQSRELDELRDKTEQQKRSLKAKEDLAKSLQLLKESGNDSPSVLQLTSLVQLESELAEAHQTVDKLKEEIQSCLEVRRKHEEDKAALELCVSELKSSCEAAVKEKLEAKTKLEVLTDHYNENITRYQKELGTHEAKRAMTEENVSESVKKILEKDEELNFYKSKVESLTKEFKEEERSLKSRLVTQEKNAHDNYVSNLQLKRSLQESKQEAAQLRQRLTQVEKEKEALLVVAKENGTTNGSGEADLIKPVIKRQALGVGIANNDDLSRMEHPPLLSPSIPPPPVMDLGGLGGPPPPPPPPGLPFDPLFNAGHFIPTPPFMSLDSGMLPPLPSIPPPPSGLLTERFRLPPLGGLMAPGSFDADYRRDLSDPPPPRRGYSPTRRLASSPLGSERSVRSDRSDRMVMDHYEFRPVSPYGRHGGRPRSVGRSRDVSPERPRSYSPLPSPLYPPHPTVNSAEDWDEGHNYSRPPMMRSGSLRQPPSGPKTSSPLVQPMDNGDRHRPPPI